MNIVRRFWLKETAQDLVEWSLLLGFIVLGSAAMMYNSGRSISPIWTATNNALTGNLQTTPATNASTNTGGNTTSGGGSTVTQPQGDDDDGGH
jgi:Flp pilus assembly pilin Flp